MPKLVDYEALGHRLIAHLRTDPGAGSPELCSLLGVSQPTFSRLVGRLPDAVLAVGRARATRYFARREVLGLPPGLPLYDVTPDGVPRRFGVLEPVHPSGYWFASDVDGLPSRHYEDLPWFMHDLRPMGFLGRLVPRRHPEFATLADVRAWSGDDALRYLSRYGFNHIGALLVGDASFQGFLAWVTRPPDAIAAEARHERYPALAADVLAAGAPGSSAAGEQPKFLATRLPGPTPVLVKFSPPLGDPQARRTADLLVAEHLALETLRAHDQAAARSEVIAAGDRVFLEVERFDRVGPHGRRGVVSLEAADSEHVGGNGGWRELTAALVAARAAPPEVLEPVRWLACFGELIGNSDMHRGNLSFFADGGVIVGVCPAYDMTPMHYAVQQNEFRSAPLTPPMPRPDDVAVWEPACRAATAFWDAVAADARISEGFRAIARSNRERVAPLGELAALLPRPRRR